MFTVYLLTLATFYVILIIENKRERTVKMKKAFTVISVIGYILLVWAIISFIDVNLHNSAIEKDCANWNFFKIISSL